MKFKIRQGTPEESKMLTEIAHAAKRHWGYPEEYIRLWKDDLTVTPECFEKNAVYVAVRGEEILGFCSVSKQAISQDARVRELEGLWIMPEVMGKGLGAMLLRHAAEDIRSEGATSLRIASDPNAEGFYLRLGAKRIGEASSSPRERKLPLLVLEISQKRDRLKNGEKLSHG